MSYSWGTPSWDDASFDGQLQVDQLRAVWQWNEGLEAWVRRPELLAQETRSAALFAQGWPVSQPPTARDQKLLANHWDAAFPLAFVQVENASDPTVVYGRIAHVSFAEAMAWWPTVVPNSAGTYDVNFRVRIFEVMDPDLRPDRQYGWNNVYGAMRGRRGYRRSTGRNNLGLPYAAGVDPKFSTWGGLTTPLSQQLVQLFLGTAPATAEDRAVWFPRGHQDLYRMPPNVGARFWPTNTDRWCWNSNTNTWQQMAVPGEWRTADGTTLNNPGLIWRDDDQSTVAVGPIAAAMRGARFAARKVKGVVVYHVTSVAQPELHAFYCKPLGATQAAVEWNLSSDQWSLISMLHYRGDASNARYYVVAVEQRQTSWRWMLHDALPNSTRCAGAINWSLDTDRIPTRLAFYARHVQTGLRTPLFPGSYEVVRRLNNTTLAFHERRS